MYPLCFNTFNHSPRLGTEVSLRTQIDAAASAGFAQLGIDGYSLDAAEAAGHGVDRVAGWLAAAGIACGTITCAGMLGVEADTSAMLARAGNRARALGAPFVQVNMGVAGDAQRALLEAACTAVGDGVRLAIEYLPFTPLARVGDTVALARSVGFDRAGVLIDVWHHERGPDGWDDLAAVPLEAIAYVEFDDALPPIVDLLHDTTENRTFPGDGVFDLPRFAQAIAAIGYRGMISIEVLNTAWRTRDVHEFARRAYTAGRRYWEMP